MGSACDLFLAIAKNCAKLSADTPLNVSVALAP